MDSINLHAAADSVDQTALRERLQLVDAAEINTYHRHGFTPLMLAARNSRAGEPPLRLLIEHGARVTDCACSLFENGRSAISLALSDGNPAKVVALLEAGAALHYSRDGFGALLDAVHGRDFATRDCRVRTSLG